GRPMRAQQPVGGQRSAEHDAADQEEDGDDRVRAVVAVHVTSQVDEADRAAHPQITTGSREPSRHHGVRSLGQTMGALLGIWDNGAGRQMFMTDDEEPKPPAGQDRDQTMSDLPDIEEPRGAYAAPETVSDVRDAARQPADEIEDTP